MQVAAEVRRTLMKRPNEAIDLNDLKVKFRPVAPAGGGPVLTPEQRLAVSKAAWLGAVGPVERVTKPKE
jgi:hypothetical protein